MWEERELFPGGKRQLLRRPTAGTSPSGEGDSGVYALALLSAVSGQEDKKPDALAEQQVGDAQSDSQPHFTTAQAWAARAAN